MVKVVLLKDDADLSMLGIKEISGAIILCIKRLIITRALRERSNTTWVESARNSLIELFEELKKQQEAKMVRVLARSHHNGCRKMKRIVKGLGTLIEEAERMRLCPAPIQMKNPAGLRATPSATSFAHHEVKFQGDVGMGKSAMARSVYSDEKVTENFPDRAWVDFSGKFDQRHLLKVIINRLSSDPIYEVEMEALELRVRQVVKKKKCMVVLDNVECSDEGFSSSGMLKFLLKLFKDCDAGSRILITTRDVKNVPRHEESKANTIMLNKLCVDDWLSILKNCLFRLTIDETVRNEVIKYYDGKALTAKSISHIVRFKDFIPQGLKVLENYKGDRFALIYLVMPDALRQCLLYCNLFPENQSIDVGKLIKLWMANDFVVSNSEDMERMGEVINFIRRIAENECHIMHLDSEKMARKKYVSVFPHHCTLNVASQSPLPESIAYGIASDPPMPWGSITAHMHWCSAAPQPCVTRPAALLEICYFRTHVS
ncbi:hypothetical protein PIB30_044719 [Stylosanthes scabra]|uniref:NB-ARC domain-containing protein n=1 Tax=Stylosanthes scabra TaxID=79078 RepID=A0ABU6VEP0_9FABA|nr:hypothetical protein [Stylosanthes scabra]